MELKIRHIVLSVFFCIYGLTSYGQLKNHPPEPRMHHDGTIHPCDGEAPTTPPPVGLCLPIDGYVYPLLVAGILLGVYSVRRMEKTAAPKL